MVVEPSLCWLLVAGQIHFNLASCTTCKHLLVVIYMAPWPKAGIHLFLPPKTNDLVWNMLDLVQMLPCHHSCLNNKCLNNYHMFLVSLSMLFQSLNVNGMELWMWIWLCFSMKWRLMGFVTFSSTAFLTSIFIHHISIISTLQLMLLVHLSVVVWLQNIRNQPLIM